MWERGKEARNKKKKIQELGRHFPFPQPKVLPPRRASPGREGAGQGLSRPLAPRARILGEGEWAEKEATTPEHPTSPAPRAPPSPETPGQSADNLYLGPVPRRFDGSHPIGRSATCHALCSATSRDRTRTPAVSRSTCHRASSPGSLPLYTPRGACPASPRQPDLPGARFPAQAGPLPASHAPRASTGQSEAALGSLWRLAFANKKTWRTKGAG